MKNVSKLIKICIVIIYTYSANGMALNTDTPTIDGSNNNQQHQDWGKSHSPLKRNVQAAYEDGLSTMSGSDRPSPRLISNIVFTQGADIPEHRGLSTMITNWGQFIAHEIILTKKSFPLEAFNIEVPVSDTFFDPLGKGTKLLPFNRSDYFKKEASSQREQINEVSSWIDGSAVYGANEERAHFLRTHKKGQMKTSKWNFLPFNTTLPNEGGAKPTSFIGGDERVNESTPLIAIHTLWVREHNRIAKLIYLRNRHKSDEYIYQKARQLVSAQIQVITYNEWLTSLFGEHKLADYSGYNPDVDPAIAHSFSVAALRIGHTMLPNTFSRLNRRGHSIPQGDLALSNAFFAPEIILREGGIAPILRGSAKQSAQNLDASVIDAVRNFLFGIPRFGGMDLVSINIMRGRDHGLPAINEVRAAYGLPAFDDFSDINSDIAVQNKLEAAYGNVDLIDPWVGMLAEQPLEGASVGSTIFTILKEQFERLRDGDRFWYQNVFEGEKLAWLEEQTLAKVIIRNTPIKRRELGHNVFLTTNNTQN